MKNLKLLLATTAMLSTAFISTAGAQYLNEPRQTTSTSVDAFVYVVSPITSLVTQEMMLGTMLAEEAGKTIVLGTNGVIDTNTSTAKFIDSTGAAAKVEFYGPFEALDTQGVSVSVPASAVTISDSVTMKVNGSGATCGTLTPSKAVTFEDGKIKASIGGTFLSADMREMTTGGAMCVGPITVTLIPSEISAQMGQ